MSCPTCDHTMQNIYARTDDKYVYWCPRCGTIKTRWAGSRAGAEPLPQIDAPKITEVLKAANDQKVAVSIYGADIIGCPWEAQVGKLDSQSAHGETIITALAGCWRET